jgi:hypothetical protein
MVRLDGKVKGQRWKVESEEEYSTEYYSEQYKYPPPLVGKTPYPETFAEEKEGQVQGYGKIQPDSNSTTRGVGTRDGRVEDREFENPNGDPYPVT